MRAEGGFLEWTEFLGHLYGTPVPVPPEGRDIVLEIDLDGVRTVLQKCRDVLVLLVLPPSEEIQRLRMQARGDRTEDIERRVRLARNEIAEMARLADLTVINADMDRAVAEMASFIAASRLALDKAAASTRSVGSLDP